MNELDQFMKKTLRVSSYARYTDDCVIVADNPDYLRNLLPKIERFLQERLELSLHPGKTVIRKFSQGIDFLGYTIFPHYRLVRTRTKQRITRKLRQRMMEYKKGTINKEQLMASLQSYLGVLSHANSYNVQEELQNQFLFWVTE